MFRYRQRCEQFSRIGQCAGRVQDQIRQHGIRCGYGIRRYLPQIGHYAGILLFELTQLLF